MIIETFDYTGPETQGEPVKVYFSGDGYRRDDGTVVVSIATLDGSRIFPTQVARTDPEAPSAFPGVMLANFATVPFSSLSNRILEERPVIHHL